MNKYNNNNRKNNLIVVIVVIFFLFIGWALIKVGTSTTQTSASNLNGLVGKPLPSIQLSDKDGKTYSLESLRGKNVVLFFNEGLMCYPACWNQVAQLGTDSRFNSPDTVALSVVVDQPGQWQQAIAKMPDLAKATMLFDRGGAASGQLGVLTSTSSMHKGSTPGHTYILLDKQGVVRFVYDDPNMAINNDMIYQKISEFNK